MRFSVVSLPMYSDERKLVTIEAKTLKKHPSKCYHELLISHKEASGKLNTKGEEIFNTINEKTKVFFDIDMPKNYSGTLTTQTVLDWVIEDMPILLGFETEYSITKNDKKESYHLVFHKLCITRDLMRKFVIKIIEKRRKIHPDIGKYKFIDTSVYSGQRPFRLPYQYKGGDKRKGETTFIRNAHIPIDGAIVDNFILNNISKLQCVDDIANKLIEQKVSKKHDSEKKEMKGDFLQLEKKDISNTLVKFIHNIDALYSDDYDTWIRILFSIKFEFGEEGVDIAREFSMKSNKFCENIFINYWDAINKDTYTAKTLYYFSMKSNKKAHKKICTGNNTMDAIREYAEVDMGAFEVVVKEDTEWLGEDKEAIKPIYNCKFIFILSAMSSGKTTFLKNELRRYEGQSILVLSSRITFSYFIEGAFSEFNLINYKNVQEGHFDECDRLIIQLESLYKVMTTYDVIILDEIESILTQFSSSTMKHPLKVWEKYRDLISVAQVVYCADAFISNKSIYSIFNMKLGREKLALLWNTRVKHSGRKVIEVGEDINDKFLEILKEDKTIYYPSTRRHKLDCIELCLKDREVDYLMYNADSDETMMNDLTRINEVWHDKRVVAVTPKVTIGCSYDLNNFDCAVFDGSLKGGCLMRDAIQSLLRVRYLNDDIVYAKLPKMANIQINHIKACHALSNYDNLTKEKSMMIFELILYDIESRPHINKQLTLDVLHSFSDIDKGFKYILWYNLREHYLSQVYGREMLLYYFNVLGYNVTEWEGKDVKEKKEVIDVDYTMYYNNITDEKTAQVKEFFMSMFEKYMDDEIMGKLFKDYYLCSHKRGVFWYVRAEKSNITKYDLFMRDVRHNELLIKNRMTANKLVYMRNMNEILGLRDTQDIGVVIDASKFNNLYEYVRKNKREFEVCFGEGRIKKMDNRGLHSFIKGVYRGWSGLEIVVNKRGRGRVAISYKTEGIRFYNHIKPLGAGQDLEWDSESDSDDEEARDFK